MHSIVKCMDNEDHITDYIFNGEATANDWDRERWAGRAGAYFIERRDERERRNRAHIR